VDAWQTEANQRDRITVSSPKSLAERCAVEGVCATKLALRIPAVIDDLANTTEEAYTAWPDRLYVIDAEGRVAYKSQPGPFGFKPAELEGALKRVLFVLPAPNQVSQVQRAGFCPPPLIPRLFWGVPRLVHTVPPVLPGVSALRNDPGT